MLKDKIFFKKIAIKKLTPRNGQKHYCLTEKKKNSYLVIKNLYVLQLISRDCSQENGTLGGHFLMDFLSSELNGSKLRKNPEGIFFSLVL